MKLHFILTGILVIYILSSCSSSKNTAVTISGVITNPKGKDVQFRAQDTLYKLTTNSEGAFKITQQVEQAGYWTFMHGDEISAMYVKPGDKIKLSIDTEQFDESIQYKGSKASSYLANKYLIGENFDLFGEKYYLSNQQEYREYLETYKNKLLKELNQIKDTAFVNSEKKSTDKDIKSYVNYQKRMADLPKTVQNYNWKSSKMINESYFYTAVEQMTAYTFDSLLDDYALNLNNLLKEVTDSEFVNKSAVKIEKTVNKWKQRKKSIDNMPGVGQAAIDFTYTDTDSVEHSLSSFKGKLVYVDVWATWCGPCKAEIPSLKQLEKDYHGKNITFLSVSVDNKRAPWLKMVAEKELKGVQLWANGWSDITKDYAIFGIPRFMLFDEEGKVISTDAPRPSNPSIRTLIDQHL